MDVLEGKFYDKIRVIRLIRDVIIISSQSVSVRRKMIISKVLFPIFLFVTSGLAEKVSDPCSEFLGYSRTPMVKCPSEKPDDYYLECYDFEYKDILEANFVSKSIKSWCWSRQDNSDDVFKNLTISAGFYDNSDLNEKNNMPFTAKFSDNGTHIICLEDERLVRHIPVDGDEHHIMCGPTSTNIPMAIFAFSRQSKL